MGDELVLDGQAVEGEIFQPARGRRDEPRAWLDVDKLPTVGIRQKGEERSVDQHEAFGARRSRDGVEVRTTPDTPRLRIKPKQGEIGASRPGRGYKM